MRARLPKPYRQSKTLWIFGSVLPVGLLAVLQQFTPALLDGAVQYLPELRGLLSPKLYALLAFALPLAGIVLRLLTSQPVQYGVQPDTGAGGKV